MSMFSFVSNLCKNLYFQVRKISLIKKYINHNVAKTLVTTLILSRIDYCNSLLAGLPKQQLQRLQNLQNNAARLITLRRKRDHVTPMLIELHWLNINDRIYYKICLFLFYVPEQHARIPNWHDKSLHTIKVITICLRPNNSCQTT